MVKLRLKKRVQNKAAFLRQLHTAGFSLLVPLAEANRWRAAVSNYYTIPYSGKIFCVKKVDGGGLLIYPNPCPRPPVIVTHAPPHALAHALRPYGAIL